MFVRPTSFYQLINDLSGTNQYLTKESSAVNFVTVPKIQINISKSKNKIKIIFQVRMMYTLHWVKSSESAIQKLVVHGI